LARGYLETLKFAIYEDIERPDDRLEEWVFTFIYSVNPATGARVVSGMNLTEECNSKTVTMGHAKLSLGRFIMELATICSTVLEPLPELAMLTIEVKYTDNRPRDYIPTGFGRPVSTLARFPDTMDWEKTTTVVGKVNTGVHQVSLKVAHLRPRHDNAPDKVPPGLSCTKEVLYGVDSTPTTIQHSTQPAYDHTGGVLVKPLQPKHLRPTRFSPRTRLSSNKAKKDVLPSLEQENSHGIDLARDGTQPPAAGGCASILARYSSADKRAKHQITHMVSATFACSMVCPIKLIAYEATTKHKQYKCPRYTDIKYLQTCIQGCSTDLFRI
jgi:hypothetical protein